jgi:hypothetical protein
MFIFTSSTSMKKLGLFILLIVALGGCKKAIENTQEDLVLLAMTDGKWKVTSFTRNGTDITADFANYRFKYYSNKTVDAINNGVVEQTGQWDGSSANHTTWANFSGAVHPIVLINGTWNIVNNSWTYVTASQTNGGDTKLMRLDKE